MYFLPHITVLTYLIFIFNQSMDLPSNTLWVISVDLFAEGFFEGLKPKLITSVKDRFLNALRKLPFLCKVYLSWNGLWRKNIYAQYAFIIISR